MEIMPIFRSIAIALLVFIALVMGLGVLLYVNCLWYSFGGLSKFEGSKLFNPYEGVVMSKGLIANFHAHSHCWAGLTNGRGTEEEVRQHYKQLGYDINRLSNYHRPDFNHEQQGLVVYEHGWGVLKAHQLVIGGGSVTWLDFPLLQNIHQKQTIVNRLRRENPTSLIVVAHPALRGAYNAEELSMLAGVNAIEAVSKMKISTGLWDEVSSLGRYLPLIGSDDCHNIYKVDDTGRCGTFVLSASSQSDSVTTAIAEGRAFAVEFTQNDVADTQQKHQAIRKTLPMKSIHSYGDTVWMEFEEVVKEVLVITDHSDTLARYSDIRSFTTVLPGDRSFLRMECMTSDGRRIYTNPLARSDGTRPTLAAAPTVDVVRTMLYRFFLILSVFILWVSIFRLIHARRKNNSSVTPKSLSGYNPRFSVFSRHSGTVYRARK